MKRISLSLLVSIALVAVPTVSHGQVTACKVQNVDSGYGGIPTSTAPQATLDGQMQGRVMLITSNADVRLIGLTLTNGFPEWFEGGGILNAGANVTLGSGTVVRANSALRGGGIFNNDGVLRLRENSTITGNPSGSDGGGGFSQFGVVTQLDASQVRRNTTLFGSGGGIAGVGAQFTIGDSACVCRNRAKTPDSTAAQRGGGSVSLAVSFRSQVMPVYVETSR